MIFLNSKPEEPVIHINEDLVINYKREGDRLLIEIRRTLTKQVVIYNLYADLQLVYNSFFSIIDSLLKDKYRSLLDLKNGQAKFLKMCNLFTKNMNSVVSENVSEHVVKCLDTLKLYVQKLVYIAENVCLEDK